VRRTGGRFFPGLLAATICLLAAALYLMAQSGRDAYRGQYRAWRDADPSLELDAAEATTSEALASRAAKAANLAAAYASAHAAALTRSSEQQRQNMQWLQATIVQPLPELAPAPDELRFVNREAAQVSATAAAFANDPDRAIQQLRQAYQREQAALEGLKASIADRQRAEDKAVKSVSAAEQARARAMRQYTVLSSVLTQSIDAMNRETAAWAAYYSKLADAAPNPAAAPPPATPASVSSIQPAPPPPVTRAPTITPVPLTRYVGVWSFRTGSPFFGSEPVIVDVVVHEDSGHAAGTFYARFKLPPDDTGDPVLRFEFSGDFKPTLKQTFTLTTNEGVAGTLDLNPGVAFNELEVNFTTGLKPGKVHQGDMILLKQ
jgi:hypothetical protein